MSGTKGSHSHLLANAHNLKLGTSRLQITGDDITNDRIRGVKLDLIKVKSCWARRIKKDKCLHVMIGDGIF
ncbi:hypothetical protein OIU84_021259 [Salix udensis]|uniref:Uncharacterized protein n=1 Tax=Salix udensis TaxID=889485 RepID=A0AAD6KWQ2_9ROSI|nr:hypothetical protein OIU84_021259 [Salix udensis]